MSLNLQSFLASRCDYAEFGVEAREEPRKASYVKFFVVSSQAGEVVTQKILRESRKRNPLRALPIHLTSHETHSINVIGNFYCTSIAF